MCKNFLNSSIYFDNTANLHPVLFSEFSFTQLIVKITNQGIRYLSLPISCAAAVSIRARFIHRRFALRCVKLIFHIANPAAEAAINRSKVSDRPSSQSGAWSLVLAAERRRGLVERPHWAAAAGGSLEAAIPVKFAAVTAKLPEAQAKT